MLRYLILLLIVSLGFQAPAQVKPGGASPMLSGGTATTMSYQAPWIGTIATTQAEINGRQVSVFDYLNALEILDVKSGLKAFDHTLKLRNAYADTKTAGMNIVFPRGVYRFTGSTSAIRTVSGDVTMEQGGYIDATGFIGTSAFVHQGQRGTPYLQVAAISAGDMSITVHATLAASLSRGDMIFITTDAGSGGNGTLWYGGRSNYYAGEMAEVRDVTGQVVSLKDPVYGAYVANTAVIAKIAYITCKISGFKIKMADVVSPEQDGLFIRYGKGCSVVDTTTEGCSHAGVFAYYHLGLAIDNLTTSAKYFTGLGTGYGFAVATCQGVRITNSRLSGARAGITTGGNEPCRDILATNTIFDNDGQTQDGCVDTHANTDGFTLNGCTLLNGAILSGKNDRLIGCNVYVRGKALQYASDWQGTHTEEGFSSGCNLAFTNCNVYAKGGLSTYGMYVTVSGVMDSFDVSGSKIISGDGTTSAWLTMTTTSGAASTGVIKRFICDHMTASATSSQHGIVFTSPITVPSVSITFPNFSLPSGAHVYWNGASAASTDIDVLNGSFESTTLNSYALRCLTSGAARIRYNGNKFKNPNLAYYPVELTASQYVECVGNQFDGMKNHAVDIVAPNILYRDNWRTNVTGSDTLNGRVYYAILPTGNVVSAGPVAPVTGAWILGDRRESTAGIVGQPKGWRCTTAGGAYSLTRADATAYTVNTWVKWGSGTTVYECTTAGTSTTGAPTAATAVGQTVTDGTVVWTCRSLTAAAFTSEGNL